MWQIYGVHLRNLLFTVYHLQFTIYRKKIKNMKYIQFEFSLL